ncbi:YceH family protein [Pleionea mediterranea]|uniref:Uncharacterized protein n=1 Tax=Pleionea mediterranea TaxID=523701 RepID=A0A316FXL9_9GAMM|nr:YceH family protein [Pleionea mediterranea]PWK53092.1 hypothetical protein C8D97_104310 [Pleionea mediterranea]
MAYDNLNDEQLRVIGCLLEKEVTTPDHYPLSINALTNACNQKSNRDPVVNYSEQQVQQVINQLELRHLVSSTSGFGSRVTKYKHRFCNTELGDFRLNNKEKAIICVLFLRGAQTPGELRSRTQRLCEFATVQDVEQTLMAMASRDKPLVVQCERQAGKRESRWLHLLGVESERSEIGEQGFSDQKSHEQDSNAPQPIKQMSDEQMHSANSNSHLNTEAHMVKLEQRIEQLEQQVQRLAEQLRELQ